MATTDVTFRLEYLREELRAERISTEELVELQSLAPYIDAGDVELLEAAGVPEFSTMAESKTMKLTNRQKMILTKLLNYAESNFDELNEAIEPEEIAFEEIEELRVAVNDGVLTRADQADVEREKLPTAKFRLIGSYDDAPGYASIGMVEAPPTMTASEAEVAISGAWEDFTESGPDSDCLFSQWLVEKHGFSELEEEFTEITLF